MVRGDQPALRANWDAPCGPNSLLNALAEAAYMTSLERNGDVVSLASYAPLLARIGNTQWNPDPIYFTHNGVYPTVNYLVQHAFCTNSGDRLTRLRR